jgi:hypothetical protein
MDARGLSFRILELMNAIAFGEQAGNTIICPDKSKIFCFATILADLTAPRKTLAPHSATYSVRILFTGLAIAALKAW